MLQKSNIYTYKWSTNSTVLYSGVNNLPVTACAGQRWHTMDIGAGTDHAEAVS